MDADALIPGRFIKSADLGSTLPPEPTYTIAAISLERVPDIKNPGKETVKGIVYFRDIEPGWVANRTNVECIKAMFGKETNDWIGKRVTLCAEAIKMPNGATETGIRVKGSPDIDREIVAEWKPARKAKQTRRLVPTGRRADTTPRTDTTKPPERPRSPTWREDATKLANEFGVSMLDLTAACGGRGQPDWTEDDYPTILRMVTEARAKRGGGAS